MHISEKVKDRISNIFGEMGIYYYDLVDDSSFLLAIVMCSPPWASQNLWS